LKTLATDQRHVVAAGDVVWFRPEGQSEGIIERVEPRHGVVSRTSRGRQHVLGQDRGHVGAQALGAGLFAGSRVVGHQALVSRPVLTNHHRDLRDGLPDGRRPTGGWSAEQRPGAVTLATLPAAPIAAPVTRRRRVSDRSRWSRPEGELPPDPWAGLVDPQPPARRSARPTPDEPTWAQQPADPAASWHPSTGPRRRTSPLQHPALWVVLTGLAVLLLVAAVLERGSSPPPPERSPGSIDAMAD
jgi:hypothetical protein